MKHQVIVDLERIDHKLRTKIIKEAQKEVLRPLAAEIKQEAPVETGELKASIKTKVGNRKKNFIITQVNIDTSEENAHAGRVEFGTREKRAQPFIRPCVKARKALILARFTEKLEEGLKEA